MGTPVSAAFAFWHPRARAAYRDAVYQRREPTLKNLRDAIWAREQAWILLELPGELERVWETARMSEGEVVGDHSARRDWLLAKLDNTTEDDIGAAVRRQIQVFIENQVQYSDHPFDPPEF